VGVAQAIDGLHKALNEISACLDRRDFYKASSLGYGSTRLASRSGRRSSEAGSWRAKRNDLLDQLGEGATLLGAGRGDARQHLPGFLAVFGSVATRDLARHDSRPKGTFGGIVRCIDTPITEKCE
jgi:hypothetical protein